MRILIAEDDEISRFLLEALLRKEGYELVVTTDGAQAWDVLQQVDPPKMAILDWEMPELQGTDICRRVRQTPSLRGLYLLMLTGKSHREHVVEGLRAGANDFIVKPFDPEELAARLLVAAQVVQLQTDLATRVRELEDALATVKQLQGLLPICSYCKKIRDDKNYWHQVEQYFRDHAEIRFSHGICPDCLEDHVRPECERFGIEVPRPQRPDPPRQ